MLRKSALVLLALLTCAPGGVDAQTADRVNPPPDRTMPGFAVLDSSIMSIEQVDPFHSTTLTLFSTLRNNDLLPRDLGVEFFPWLVTRPNQTQTLSEAYQQRYRPGFAGALRQFLGASMTISQNVGDSSGIQNERSLAHVAIAVRTLLRSGRPNRELADLLQQYDERTQELDKAIREQADAAQRQEAEQRAADLLVRSRGLLAQLSAADKSRVGFMLETGGAYALVVPNNTLEDAKVARRAWWLTPIYRFDTRPVSISGTTRLIGERERGMQIFDIGGRISLRWQGVSYSLEGLGRKRWIDEPIPEEDLLNGRLIGGVSYGLGRSALLTFVFGKNYKDPLSGGGTLVASFGITLGLGEIQLGIPTQ